MKMQNQGLGEPTGISIRYKVFKYVKENSINREKNKNNYKYNESN